MAAATLKPNPRAHGGHARAESGGNGVRLAKIMISKRPEVARFALIREESPLPKSHPETRQVTDSK